MRTGESKIVPDTHTDAHYFEGVDQATGFALRSILSVPLHVKENIIGVIQAVDTRVGRFSPADLDAPGGTTTVCAKLNNANLIAVSGGTRNVEVATVRIQVVPR